MSGEGEEISISVRWKKPVARFARALFGGATVVVLLRLPAGAPVAPRDAAAITAIEWSCDAERPRRSFGVSDPSSFDECDVQPRAETRRNDADAQRHDSELLERELTGVVIREFYGLYNRLGIGYEEKVYAEALRRRLVALGIDAKREAWVEAWDMGECVGRFRADMLIGGKVIVEIKAGDLLPTRSRRQLHNYLRCSDLEVGLLLFFGPSPRFQRFVHTRNDGRMRDDPH